MKRWSSATDYDDTSVRALWMSELHHCHSMQSNFWNFEAIKVVDFENGPSLSMIGTIPALKFGVVPKLISLHLHKLSFIVVNPNKNCEILCQKIMSLSDQGKLLCSINIVTMYYHFMCYNISSWYVTFLIYINKIHIIVWMK